jgi:hypothetical protein
MKKLTSLLLLLSSAAICISQITFSTRLEAYNNLTGAKNHSDTVKWDDPDLDLLVPMAKLGFYFQGMGIKGDSVIIGEGWVYIPSISGIEGLYVKGIGVDIVDRGYNTSTALSPISSITTGVTGDRIFKIEFKNFGFFGEFSDANTLKDFGNMQIWFYEKGNFIELHYGPFSVAKNTSYGGLSGLNIYAGLHNLKNKSLIGIALDGDQAKPLINKNTYNGILIGHPELGRVYRFEIPASASIETLNQLKVRIYPQPANDILRVEFPEESGTHYFKVHSIIGELISSGLLENNSIDLKSYKNGLYVLTIEQNGKESYRLFQKI